jgi:hypothetical protein
MNFKERASGLSADHLLILSWMIRTICLFQHEKRTVQRRFLELQPRRGAIRQHIEAQSADEDGGSRKQRASLFCGRETKHDAMVGKQVSIGGLVDTYIREDRKSSLPGPKLQDQGAN